MGKNKKRFNWKAREIIKTDVDRSEQQKIKIDLESSGKYDESNALVLPSKKRKTKIKKESKPPQKKLLSKKQRKKLEKILERKKLKSNRASMLEALAKVQASSEELGQMTSITTVQTKGLKRLWSGRETVEDDVPQSDMKPTPSTINAVKGNNRKRRKLLAALMMEKPKKARDPNVVGIESSNDELSSSDNEDGIKIEKESDSETDERLHKENYPELEQVTEEIHVLEEDKIEENNGETETVVEDGKTKEELKAEVGKVEEVERPKKIEEGIGTALPRKKAVFVPVVRDEKIEEGRKKLPILGEEQVIMEAIAENSVIILAGETGSGKTTQVPQFLYEAGYANDGKTIGVTEPRRVAAMAMSKRVGLELGLGEAEVSYLVRFEGNTTPETKIKFMTDGVLLKEIHSDFLLSRYSVVIVDEAHERSVSTDVVLGLLSRIVPLREKRGAPLKLVIMSATLRVKDFTENKHLFPNPPPVIRVESRQFPVTVHFNKRTDPDYMKEAFRKVCRIHSQLPDGGILVFLTGQQEVKSLVRKLRESFPMRKEGRGGAEAKPTEEEEEINLKEALKRARAPVALPKIDLDRYATAPVDDAEMDLLDEGGGSSDEEWGDESSIPSHTSQPIWALPLYSLLPSYKQAKVFQGAPAGCRLCVVSTNVSETSLTIPGVKYVIDSGKVKRKVEDKLTGVTGFQVAWASKAEANQRAGRAGRQCPGHAYRLYSSAVFNDNFPEWSEPEIKRRGVEDLVLNMKALGIHRVAGFPFPTPPDREQLETAEKTLTVLGAIDPPPPLKDKFGGKLTPLGESMSALPLGPRYAKMVCLSEEHRLTDFCLALVAGLSVQELLLPPDAETKMKRRKAAGHSNSLLLGDVMVVLKVVGGSTESLGVREQGLAEARKLRNQLVNQVALSCPQLNLSLDPKLKAPSDTQARLLRQIVLSGLVDRVAKLVTEAEDGGGGKGKAKPIYETMEMEERVEMSRDSVLARERPHWVVYQEAYSLNGKMYIRGVTAIEPEWLLVLAPSLCNMSEPLDDPPPRYDQETDAPKCHVNSTYGRRGWVLPPTEIEFPEGLSRYRWLCVFLLQGVVFPKLARFTKSLLSSPQTMVKSWAKLQPRTELLLKTLVSREADSKEKLVNIWSTDKLFMLSAYQKWLPESASNEVATLWPPI